MHSVQTEHIDHLQGRCQADAVWPERGDPPGCARVSVLTLLSFPSEFRLCILARREQHQLSTIMTHSCLRTTKWHSFTVAHVQ
jgi:hypothetical protein